MCRIGRSRLPGADRLPNTRKHARRTRERREELAAKIRVYELGRELGLTNKEALDLCLALGIGVKSHSSSIEEQQADRVRRKADQEGLRRPVEPQGAPAPEPEPAAVASDPTAPSGRVAVRQPATEDSGVDGQTED